MHHVEIVSQLEPDHLEQLPELIRSATLVDGHEPLGEHKFLRLRQGADEARAVLAYDAGKLLGYAHTVTYGAGDERRVTCEFVVHPAHRRRGIGRELLASAVIEAQQHEARRMDLWAYNDSDASARVAAQFGFKPARRLLHLHRHMRALVPPATADGVRIRAFRPGADEAAWLALNARAFADHPEQPHWTADDLRARMQQPWFNPDDFLIAEDEAGAVVAFNWLKIEDRPNEGSVGEIYVIGVDPAHRGHGLGTVLLSAGLRHMRERGVDVAAIYVDESNAAALRLYEGMGFHHHHVDVCYSRPLGAGEQIDGAVAAA